MSTKLLEIEKDGVSLYLTRFYGGHERGPMVQIGIDDYFIQLNSAEIKKVIKTLKHYKEI